ncbi:MAG: DUF485 domain-containing protein [Acidimicrobiia bacterium]|nr:DUF485 domain-containing protein [Acidimicrobiia bacterium]
MKPDAETVKRIDWDEIETTAEFQQLLAAKRRFIVRATLFFIVYYFALPVLVGWVPQWMSAPVLGPLNVAYLFALSQFLMAWCVAALYVRQASRWDRVARQIVERRSSAEGD